MARKNPAKDSTDEIDILLLIFSRTQDAAIGDIATRMSSSGPMSARLRAMQVENSPGACAKKTC
jgi:hypothetical protein